jgi:thiosulfate/3-mercaptopyruvate sulfurtransferase
MARHVALLLVLAVGLVLPMATLAADDASPVSETLDPHPEWLIEASELRAMLAADASVKVVALQPAEEFSQAHIPGAAQIDWPDLEIVETSDQRVATWRVEVEAKLTALGLTPSDTVVIYDFGTLYAARLWWILDQLGHEDNRILNGGFGAWQAAGGETENGPSRVEPAAEPYVGTPNEDAIATLAEVQDALDDPNVVLVDARRPDEYVEGHIPGAINIEFTRNADDSGHWLSADKLLAMYAAAGVTPDKTVIPYCSTGVRSAVTYFTLRLLGYPRVTLFTGSFKEWSSHPELPVATGARP